jgi:hypothetical protein
LKLCRREEATSRATLWSPQKACQQAFAENLGNSPAWGADPQRRQSADPQWNWSADPHRSQSADPLSGADLRARTPSAGRARTPSGTGARTPTVARARTPEETSCPACWRAPRPVKFLAHAYATCAVMRELDRERKPRAPPAGGRRGQVESLAHAYATCAVMS